MTHARSLHTCAGTPSCRAGYGNIGTNAQCGPGFHGNSSNENALLGYAPTTARHYGADYQVRLARGFYCSTARDSMLLQNCQHGELALLAS